MRAQMQMKSPNQDRMMLCLCQVVIEVEDADWLEWFIYASEGECEYGRQDESRAQEAGEACACADADAFVLLVAGHLAVSEKTVFWCCRTE